MKIEDYNRGTEINFSESVDLDGQLEILGNSDQGDTVWFYMNEKQAKAVIRHLTRVFSYPDMTKE